MFSVVCAHVRLLSSKAANRKVSFLFIVIELFRLFIVLMIKDFFESAKIAQKPLVCYTYVILFINRQKDNVDNFFGLITE